MNSQENKKTDKYGKLIKVLQILSFAFMLVMLVLCVTFLSKNNISVSNVGALTQYLTGGTLTVAAIIIGFSVIKSFALVFPPIVLFVISGMIFDNLLTAVAVNFVASAASLILPYYLYALPALLFALAASLIMGRIKKNKEKQLTENIIIETEAK